MTRRAHGTGSITPLPGGGYQVAIEAGWTAKGTRRRIRRNIRTTGRDGLAEAKATLRDLLREGDPPPEPSDKKPKTGKAKKAKADKAPKPDKPKKKKPKKAA